MNVTMDVIRDLLPLYVAGEASADSRVLVDAFVHEHADMRGELDRLREAFGRATRLVAPPEKDLSKLRATKRLLRARGHLLAGAIFCTALPCSFVFANGEMQWMMIRDATGIALVSVAAALGLWVAYLRVDSRLSVRGF